MTSNNREEWGLKMAAKPAVNETPHQLHQLRQLLLDFESVFALLNMYPELARTKDPESSNMLPLHTAMMIGAPTTTVMILLEAYPDAVKCFDVRKREHDYQLSFLESRQVITTTTTSNPPQIISSKTVLSHLNYTTRQMGTPPSILVWFLH